MAFTEIHSITGSTKAAIKYITNPEKTTYHEPADYDGDGTPEHDISLVTAFECTPQFADLEFDMTGELAHQVRGTNDSRVGHDGKGTRRGETAQSYHLIQSFAKADEVAPEVAHQIGIEMMQELLGGEFEYVVATHVDRDHVHNHIIFNATSVTTLKKFRSQPYRTAALIREVSNRLCAEHGISIMEPGSSTGTTTQAKEEQYSLRSELKRRLRFALDRATNPEEFRVILAALEIDYDETGKYLRYSLPDQDRAARDRSLSKKGTDEFGRTGIEARFSANKSAKETLKTAIKDAYEFSDSLDDVEAELRQKGITMVVKKDGTVQYSLPGFKQKFSEALLPAEYRVWKMKLDWRNPDHFDHAGKQQPLLEEYKELVLDRRNKAVSRVELSDSQIAAKTKNGLLINVKVGEVQHNLFVDRKNTLVDKDGHTTVLLNSIYSYNLVEQKNHTKPFGIRGETLIRSLELAAGQEPQWVSLAPQLVRASPKGLSVLLVPNAGSVFIPKSEVRYNQQTLRYEIAVGKNWNYFAHPLGDAIPGQYLTGDKFLQAIGSAKPTLDIAIEKQMQIGFFIHQKERFAELTGVMNQLQEAGITTVADIDEQIAKLRLGLKNASEQIERVDKKITRYNEVAKLVVTVDALKPLIQELDAADAPSREHILKTRSNDIRRFNLAVAELKQASLNPNLSPEQVKATVDENKKLRKSSVDRVARMKHDLTEWEVTQKVVKEAREEQKTKQIEREI